MGPKQYTQLAPIVSDESTAFEMQSQKHRFVLQVLCFTFLHNLKLIAVITISSDQPQDV